MSISSLTPLSFPVITLEPRKEPLDEAYDPRERVAPGAAFVAPARPVRVLVVASEATRTLAELAFVPFGFHVRLTGELDAEEARRFSPDVVFLEVGSEGEAFSLVQKVRGAARLWMSQVILITALKEGEQLAVRIGAQGYLAAPLFPRRLQAAMAAACARLHPM